MVESVALLAGIEKGLEIALIAEGASLQAELVIPTLIVLGTTIAVHEVIKAVRRHKAERQAEEQARIAEEEARVIEEEKAVEEAREMSAEEMEQYGITSENIE